MTMSYNYHMSTLLITGASGYVGASIYEYFSKIPDIQVIGTYHKTKLFPELVRLDVTDPKAVAKCIESCRPDVIIHAANEANPRLCNSNPEHAKKLNVDSARYICDALQNMQTKVIYISSQSVIVPIGVYSETKKAAEAIFMSRKNSVIIRPFHILGLSPNTTNDRAFNRYMKKYLEKSTGEYGTAFRFQITYTQHLNHVINEVIRRDISNEVIPVACKEIKNRFQTASDIFGPLGASVKALSDLDDQPPLIGDISKLKLLNLPTISYSEAVKKMTNEVKQAFNS